MSYNEADTRAKLIDPALHANRWIERVAGEQRADHGAIRREQSAVRIDILDGKPLKRGRGRVDYLLCVYLDEHEQPLTLAFVEAKKEKQPPTQGLEQVKEYARRHAVKFVYYSTNGHQFIEYDAASGKTSDPQPMANFPTPQNLRQRWFAATGLDANSPAVAPLLTPYSVSGDRPRYYQDAAIRAVLERAALAAAGKAKNRALLSLATGAGKTSIAVGLLQRLSDAASSSARCFWRTATNCGNRRSAVSTTCSAPTQKSWGKTRRATMRRRMRASISPRTNRSASMKKATLPFCADTIRKITSATS